LTVDNAFHSAANSVTCGGNDVNDGSDGDGDGDDNDNGNDGNDDDDDDDDEDSIISTKATTGTLDVSFQPSTHLCGR